VGTPLPDPDLAASLIRASPSRLVFTLIRIPRAANTDQRSREQGCSRSKQPNRSFLQPISDFSTRIAPFARLAPRPPHSKAKFPPGARGGGFKAPPPRGRGGPPPLRPPSPPPPPPPHPPPPPRPSSPPRRGHTAANPEVGGIGSSGQ
jgi:hypothetical protein